MQTLQASHAPDGRSTDPSPFAPLAVLYADAYLLVLHKPSGLLSVPGRGADKQDCASLRAQARFPDALVVHLLDQGTSGLLLMARGAAAQRTLSAAFAQRAVHKRYLAQVAADCGHANTWQSIDLPIGRDWDARPLRKIDLLAGQPSSTRWRCLHFDEAAQRSVLELEPLTGRSHQLRLHLQALGYPIVGDTLYAPEAVATLSPRLMLHAWTLTLNHPETAQPLHFCAPCDFYTGDSDGDGDGDGRSAAR